MDKRKLTHHHCCVTPPNLQLPWYNLSSRPFLQIPGFLSLLAPPPNLLPLVTQLLSSNLSLPVPSESGSCPSPSGPAKPSGPTVSCLPSTMLYPRPLARLTLCSQILRDPAGERYRGHLAALSCRTPEAALLKLGSPELRCLEVRELDVNAVPRLFIVHVDRVTLSR